MLCTEVRGKIRYSRVILGSNVCCFLKIPSIHIFIASTRSLTVPASCGMRHERVIMVGMSMCKQVAWWHSCHGITALLLQLPTPVPELCISIMLMTWFDALCPLVISRNDNPMFLVHHSYSHRCSWYWYHGMVHCAWLNSILLKSLHAMQFHAWWVKSMFMARTRSVTLEFQRRLSFWMIPGCRSKGLRQRIGSMIWYECDWGMCGVCCKGGGCCEGAWAGSGVGGGGCKFGRKCAGRIGMCTAGVYSTKRRQNSI